CSVSSLSFIIDLHPRSTLFPYTTLFRSFVLRTATEPAAFVSEVRRLIHSIDPDVPITSLHHMTQIVSQSLDARRFPMFISMSFRSEEHTSELQSHLNLVCRLLLEKKKLM